MLSFREMADRLKPFVRKGAYFLTEGFESMGILNIWVIRNRVN